MRKTAAANPHGGCVLSLQLPREVRGGLGGGGVQQTSLKVNESDGLRGCERERREGEAEAETAAETLHRCAQDGGEALGQTGGVLSDFTSETQRPTSGWHQTKQN